jgi:hypothetical protein
MTNYSKLWAVVAGGAFLTTAACNESRDTGTVTTRTSEGTSSAPAAEVAENRDVAMVRVVNAIPGDKSVTVWAGDSMSFADVGYKSTSDWRQIPDDRFNFQIRGAGTEPLAQNRENLQGGGHYTIVALPDEGGPDKRNLRVLDDDLKPVSADKARVRFINGVPGNTDVDLVMSGREEPVFDGVNFKAEAGWNEIDPVSGALFVRTDNDTGNTLVRVANVKLEGGKSYTFVFTGRAGKYELIKIEDNVAQDARRQWDGNDTRERVEPAPVRQ